MALQRENQVSYQAFYALHDYRELLLPYTLLDLPFIMCCMKTCVHEILWQFNFLLLKPARDRGSSFFPPKAEKKPTLHCIQLK